MSRHLFAVRALATAAGVLALTLFTATVAAATAAEEDHRAPALEVSGSPIIYTFDTGYPYDSVEGTWTLTARDDLPLTYDGTFTAIDSTSSTFSDALTVEYGIVDDAGDVSKWMPAGTLADPVPYTTAIGTTGTIHRGKTTIPVRVTLTDPSVAPAGQPQTVMATFTVGYLTPPPADAESDAVSGTDVRTPPGLAATGGSLLGWPLLAVAAIFAGIYLFRRSRAQTQ